MPNKKNNFVIFKLIVKQWFSRGGAGEACPPPPKEYLKNFCIFHYSKKIILTIILLIKELNI